MITSLLTSKAHSTTRFKEVIDELNEFMDARLLSVELRKKLNDFYMLKFPTMKIFDEERVFAGLPWGLKRLVCTEIFQDVLRGCPLFHGMSDTVHDVTNFDSLASEICSRFTDVYKTKGLHLTTEGSIPDALYVLRYGELSVESNGIALGTLKGTNHDVVGEMALLGLSRDGRRLRTAVCNTMCELCTLTKEDLLHLLSIPEFQRPLKRMLAIYTKRLQASLSRGHPQGCQDELQAIPWHSIKQQLDTDRNSSVHLMKQTNSDRNSRWGARPGFRNSVPGQQAEGIKAGPAPVLGTQSLTTSFYICIDAISAEQEQTQHKKNVVLEIVWKPCKDGSPGLSHGPPESVFSKVMCVQFSNGRSEQIENGCVVWHLVHPRSTPLKDLPNAKLVMYEVKDEVVADQLSTGLAGKPDGLTFLGAGDVSMQILLDNRSSASTDAKRISKALTGDDGANVGLEMRISVKRWVAPGSKWNCVLNLLRNRADSKYFEKQLKLRIRHIRYNIQRLFLPVNANPSRSSVSLSVPLFVSVSAPVPIILLPRVPIPASCVYKFGRVCGLDAHCDVSHGPFSATSHGPCSTSCGLAISFAHTHTSMYTYTHTKTHQVFIFLTDNSFSLCIHVVYMHTHDYTLYTYINT